MAVLALVALVGSLYVVNGVADQRTFVEQRRAMSPDLQRLLRGIQAATADQAPFLNDIPFPIYHPNITTTLLGTPELRGALPETGVSPTTQLDGQALVNVGVAPATFGLPETTELDSSLKEGQRTDDGCATYSASGGGAAFAFVSPEEGAEISVTGPAQSMTTKLERDGLASLSSTRVLTPGETIFIGVRVPGATLRVLFDQPGSYSVCSATAPPAR